MSELRRVALISPYALDIYGGVQEQVLGMSRELVRRGLDVLVLSPEGGELISETPARVERYGGCVRVPANGSQAPITLSPTASKRVRQAIERFGPDVVHIHEPFAPLLSYAELFSGAERARVGTFHRSGGGPAYQLTRPLLVLLLRQLDAKVAVSDRAAETLQEATGASSTVLFNGFEMDRFAQQSRDTDPFALFVGRFESRKGAHVAIEAVRGWKKLGGPSLKLLIAGDGPERESLEQLAGGDDAITFLGAVDDTVKRDLLGRASILIAPSLFGESFGMTLLEGMASGAAVVASDIDGYREAAGGHATLFTPDDATDLRRALLVALATSPRARDAARLHAENWSMARLMDDYLPIYEAALARR